MKKKCTTPIKVSHRDLIRGLIQNQFNIIKTSQYLGYKATNYSGKSMAFVKRVCNYSNVETAAMIWTEALTDPDMMLKLVETINNMHNPRSPLTTWIIMTVLIEVLKIAPVEEVMLKTGIKIETIRYWLSLEKPYIKYKGKGI